MSQVMRMPSLEITDLPLKVRSATVLQCPVCEGRIIFPEIDKPSTCSRCEFVLTVVDGIVRGLPANRYSYFNQFMRDYEFVRSMEGRGADSADYYLGLPFKDVTGRHTWQWNVRAHSFRCLEKHLLPHIEKRKREGCDILDLGAGNCWLSFRLALRGHRPVAVDLLDNASDGLRSAKHYFDALGSSFPLFQAEMDHLPFASGQFDVAIYNASLHYSMDYEVTIREALRCLRRPGCVVIVDSPFYRHDASGQAMVREKHAMFEEHYGFRSDSLRCREYLTPEILKALTENLSLEWKLIRPWHGVSWALRPVRAYLKRQRTPSEFFLIWTEVTK